LTVLSDMLALYSGHIDTGTYILILSTFSGRTFKLSQATKLLTYSERARFESCPEY